MFPARGTPGTIQSTIFPPATTWSWPDLATRDSQAKNLTEDDRGKYGIVESNHTLYRLVSVVPNVAWEAVQTFSDASWEWANKSDRLTQHVQGADIGKIGVQKDIDTYYKLTSADPKIWQQVANPTNPSPLELSTGASDAESYHDFYRLQIAFDDVWSEVTDRSVPIVARTAYAMWDRIIAESGDHFGEQAKQDLENSTDINKTITGIGELDNFITNLKYIMGITGEDAGSSGSPATNTSVKNGLTGIVDSIEQLKSRYYSDPLGTIPTLINGVQDIENGLQAQIQALSSQTSPPDVDPFIELKNLIVKLDLMMKEKYRFDVFAPGSINYGVLFNYRQHWVPQSYQVEIWYTTIPLAPQETRRYTTKTVVKKTRSVKEIEDAAAQQQGQILQHLARGRGDRRARQEPIELPAERAGQLRQRTACTRSVRGREQAGSGLEFRADQAGIP